MVTGDRGVGGNTAVLSRNDRSPIGESLAHTTPLEGSTRTADCIDPTEMAAATPSFVWAARSTFPDQLRGVARLGSTGGCQFLSSFTIGSAGQSVDITAGIGCACCRTGLPASRCIGSTTRLVGWRYLWPGSGAAGVNGHSGGGSSRQLARRCSPTGLVGGWVVPGVGWVVA